MAGETATLATVAITLKGIKEDVRETKDAVLAQNGRLRQCEIDIARLQIKAAVWGLAAGLLPSVGAILFWMASQ